MQGGSITSGYNLTTIDQDIRRCGVIPYTVIGKGKDIDYSGSQSDLPEVEELMFLLAQDMLTKEYGDFGGTVKKMENPLHAACREFREESRGIFPDELYNDYNVISSSLCCVHNGMAIVFVPVEADQYELAEEKFKRVLLRTEKCYREIDGVKWVSSEELRSMISESCSSPTQRTPRGNPRLWPKIGNFLASYNMRQINEIIKTVYPIKYPLRQPSIMQDMSSSPIG